MLSKFADSALPQIEFNVELHLNQDTFGLAAGVRREIMKASQLSQPSGAARHSLFSRVVLAQDVSSEMMIDIWEPLLENLKMFSAFAEAVIEVRLLLKFEGF